MPLRVLVASIVALPCFVVAAPALGHAPAASPCSSGNVATTASYRMALDIGKQEDMYLPSEVKARHIKDGEIMLGGEMSMVRTPPAGSRVYHLEVHICDKSGAVVKRLNPTIVAGTKNLPAAIMVGIGAPSSDYHYGNDIVLKPGTRLTVTVTVKGEQAVFHATVPKI
jgi:hypothetical protein